MNQDLNQQEYEIRSEQTKIVWLIRHGESATNAGLVTPDPRTAELTDRGYQQSHYVADAMPTEPDLVVVSPYIRTLQTARATLKTYPSVQYETWDVFEFTFLDPIKHANTNIMQRAPFKADYWQRNDPDYEDGNGAESYRTFMGRIERLRDRLFQVDVPFMTIFSHGQFIRGFLFQHANNWLPVTSKTMQRFYWYDQSLPVPNCMIIKMLVMPSGKIYLSGMNTNHLPETLINHERLYAD